jgi:TolB-like protein
MPAIQNIFRKTAFLAATMLLSTGAFAQGKPTIAVLNIATKGLVQDAQAMGYLVRLELEKTGVYSVMDRYEVADVVAKAPFSVDSCFSKTCLVDIGRHLGVAKMMSGSAERFGEKIVITLRLIDVASGTIEKSEATEYLNLPEVQKMVQISVEKMAGLPPDPTLVSMLIDYNTPIESPNTSFTNNGPRMGFSYTMGDAAKRMQAPKDQGGFGMWPLMFQFGWQQEISYISAGNFQALVEFVPSIGGLESGLLIPSLSTLQGFRFGKLGLEFALGPTFRLVQLADGYFDNAGTWHLGDAPAGSGFTTKTLPDKSGDLKIVTSLLFVGGLTIHSGYLNIPLNVYFSPRKDASVVGFSFGFNVHKKKAVE